MEPTNILPIVFVLSLVTVEYGGWALLTFITGRVGLADWQKGFFRAGHAHAGVLLVLSPRLRPVSAPRRLLGRARMGRRRRAPHRCVGAVRWVLPSPGSRPTGRGFPGDEADTSRRCADRGRARDIDRGVDKDGLAPTRTERTCSWWTEESIETSASERAIWRLWADVPWWPDWTADIEHIELSGPVPPAA